MLRLFAMAPLAVFVASPLPAQDITTSETLYQEHCASCHGKHLEGEPNWREMKDDGTLPAPPHDRSGHTWHHTDKALFDYIKLGGAGVLARMGIKDVNSGMPAFADVLTDDEIWAILDFIKLSWPAEIQQAQSDRSKAAGEER